MIRALSKLASVLTTNIYLFPTSCSLLDLGTISRTKLNFLLHTSISGMWDYIKYVVVFKYKWSKIDIYLLRILNI